MEISGTVVEASHHCQAPSEISTGLKVGFRIVIEPPFMCPLIKASAVGTLLTDMRGTPIRTFSWRESRTRSWTGLVEI